MATNPAWSHAHAAGVFGLTLVKADGARGRGIKAPRADEPRLVPGTDTVIHVVSARCLNEPLNSATAHRPERLGEVLDLPIGECLTPEVAARLLSHPRGARQHVGHARLQIIINQVDDDGLQRLARRMAARAMAACPALAPIVLTSFAPQPRIVARLDE